MFSNEKLIKRISGSTRKNTKFLRNIGNELTPTEEDLFESVANGDAKTISQLLEEHRGEIDWSKKDFSGYTLMQEAVLHQNCEIIQILMENGCDCKKGLVLAAKRGDWKTKSQIEKIVQTFSEKGCSSSKTYEYLTPHIPAKTEVVEDDSRSEAKNNKRKSIVDDTESLKLLILAATTENVTEICKQLKFESIRIPSSEQKDTGALKSWKALTSASYMLLTNKDPVLTALIYSDSLEKQARLYPEDKDNYRKLSDNCSDFLAELLSLCKTKKEVECILSQRIDSTNPISCIGMEHLQAAIGLKQKKFVTDSLCQHVLYTKWVPNYLSEWRIKKLSETVFYIISHIMLSPFLCLMIILVGRRKDETIDVYQTEDESSFFSNIDAPFNRFLYAVTFYVIFLIFLLINVLEEKDKSGTPHLFWLQVAIPIWVVGHAVKIVRNWWFESICNNFGFNIFKVSWWIRFELIMVVLFIIASSCSLGSSLEENKVKSIRLSMVSDALWSLAVTMAYIRILQWFHLSERFSHIIISFSEMMDIVVEYAVVFGIVFIAFSVGIYSVYKDYSLKDGEQTSDKLTFLSYQSTLFALFWALFGEGEPNYADVPEHNLRYNISVQSMNYSAHEDNFNINHNFNIIIGYLLWGGFHVIFIIIILNMVIAIMTKTMEHVYANEDVEWKFARTKLWLHYFDPYNAVPPPLNLIWLLKCLLEKYLSKIPFQCCKNQHSENVPTKEDVEGNKEKFCKKEKIELLGSGNPLSSDESYDVVMNKLTKRYFRKKSLSTV